MFNKTRKLATSKSAPSLIADAIRAGIHSGEFANGMPLRQEELAERFGVSRIPIREGLLLLEAEGLITIHPNRGACVVSHSDEDLSEIYELRILLEVDLLARSVPRMSEAHLARLEKMIKIAELETDFSIQGTLDEEFHVALYEPAERNHQLALIKKLRGMVLRYDQVQDALLRQSEGFVDHHRYIVAACRLRDVRAAKDALAAHLQSAARVANNQLKAMSNETAKELK
ncbi:MAG: hypothetical protein A2X86_14805 [Bdellovibrionales bacterium GWA2_49_15]|nr:MAG: hypothetical protein A2X86_14805 [Bdellovibrionales bacterium GWA2_49_15]